MDLTGRQSIIYQTLREAAEAGQICPTNQAIATRCGLASTSSVADVISRLQKKGLFEVTRYNRARIVLFPDLGLATAEPPSKSALAFAPHWRKREAGVSYAPEPEAPVFPDPPEWRLRWRPQRWQPKTCQYIAGDPSTAESAKCGLPVTRQSSYCGHHHVLCHQSSRSQAA